MKLKVYLKLLWTATKKFKGLMVLVLVSSLLTTIAFLLFPFFGQQLIDQFISPISNNAWYEVSEQSKDAVYLNGKYYEQVPKKILESTKTNYLRYQGEQAFFVLDIPENIKVSHIENGRAIQENGTILPNEIIPLNSQQIQIMYQPMVEKYQKFLWILLILVLFHPIVAWLNSWSVKRLSRSVIAKFRIEGFEKLHRLPIKYFSEKQDGKLVSYLVNDTMQFAVLVNTIGVQIFQAVAMFIGIYVLLLVLDWRIFLGALCFLPILYLWIRYFRQRMSFFYEKARHASSGLNALLNEQFKGISVIRAFNYEKQAAQEFNGLNDEVYDYNEKTLKLRAFLTGSVVNVIRRTLWMFILLYAGFAYFKMPTIGLTAGTIYLLVNYVSYYVEPLYQLFSVLSMVEQANVSVQRYFRFMLEDEEVERVDAISSSVPRFKGAIQFKNLQFGYQENNLVLKNLNLRIEPNQTVAIVGHTGSGKSSMMNLLMRFYDYQDGKGEILVDDYEIKNLTRAVYREHIGIILQDPILFRGTLYETITWDNPKFTKEYVTQVLNDIGAAELLDHPDGLDREVIEMGQNFSLGERQLIAFARAVVANPAILILDEATANIDTETERKIQEALKIASLNRTTFIIAHRLSTIKDADIIVVLDKGVIVEQGTHEQLLKNKKYYYQMYQAQAN